MTEDIIITIICISLIAGAYLTGYFLRNTKVMKIFITLMKPLTWLKNALDPNHLADRVGNKKGGVYDKARNSKLNKWSSNLTGWKWWAWQVGVGGVFFILIEIILNMIGLTMLPW